MRERLAACVMTLLVVETLHAEDFYVDPVAGSASGDGSQAAPWQGLEAVVSAGHFGKEIKAGDNVWLRAGYHGSLSIKSGSYAPPISIAAESGQLAKLSRISLAQTRGWVISGLSVSPSHAASAQVANIIQVDKASAEIVIRDCDVFSVSDSSAWGTSEWINVASSGAQISGDHITLSDNRVKNVRFGISVDGTNALIERNQVLNFSADGLRGLGDHEVFQFNVVKNVYVSQDDGDDNHDDGFQSWSTGPDGPGSGVVRDIVLRGNYFLNREDPQQKFPNDMQGIGCFDGFFEDWVVENNVVATNHWHGISFYGMRNSRVVNNTVIDIDVTQPGPPWIMVTAHKNGSASENVIVRNNLATDYDVSGTNVVQDHNTELKTLNGYFVDAARFDLHLLPNAPALDLGSADQAPAFDADGIARPQGKAVDLGAYEWHEASVQPKAPGQGGGGASGQAGGRAGPAADGGKGAGGVAAPSGGGAGRSAGSGRSAGGTSGMAAGAHAVAGDGRAEGNPEPASGGCSCQLLPLSTRAPRSAAWLAVSCLAFLWRRRARRKAYA